jgi:glutathione S-transferase
LPEARKTEYVAKQPGGHKALAVMEQQLARTPYLVSRHLTIADISPART